jgi:hypothetical protein
VDVVFSSHGDLRGKGGRGRRLYPAGKSSWTASSASTHHAVLVRVTGWSLSLEEIELGGAVVDRLDLERL